jgi:hypothetical protein
MRRREFITLAGGAVASAARGVRTNLAKSYRLAIE